MASMRRHPGVFASVEIFDMTSQFNQSSALPPDLGAVLPNLTAFACESCSLKGSIPPGKFPAAGCLLRAASSRPALGPAVLSICCALPGSPQAVCRMGGTNSLPLPAGSGSAGAHAHMQSSWRSAIPRMSGIRL